MKRKIFIFLLIITHIKLFSLDESSIVKIVINEIEIATGFAISNDGIIVTAYHAIAPSKNRSIKNITVVINNKKIKNPKIISFDELRDIAVLDINTKTIPLICASHEELKSLLSKREGYAYGYPDGKPLFHVDINITRDDLISCKDFIFPNYKRYFSLEANNVPIISFNGSISPGMSGGPIIIDNKVVGIISGTQNDQGDTFGWAIPVYIKDKLLEKNFKKNKYKYLPELKLINNKYSDRFIKTNRYLNFNDYDDIKLVIISKDSWIQNINNNDIIRSYTEKGIQIEQIYLSEYWDKMIFKEEYVKFIDSKISKNPKLKPKFDFWYYIEHRNKFSLSSSDIKIIKKYNIDHSPIVIGYYKSKEINRYVNDINMYTYLYYYNIKEDLAKSLMKDNYNISGEGVEIFLDFLQTIIDYAAYN